MSMTKLTTKQAVLKVLRDMHWSKYKLAQEMGVRPIMISNYLKDEKPTKMSGRTADRFEDTFGIEITDAYRPTKELEK